MQTAKLFTNGRSQAVRLPKDCRFIGREKEVYVHKMEGMVILIPKKDPWAGMLRSLERFTDDFMDDRALPKRSDQREGMS